MIDQLGEAAPGREITLRVNPGFGHGHSRKTNTGGDQSKHGIWHEQLDDCLRRADHHGLAVTGLHLHIGSGTDLAASVASLRVDGEAGRGRGPFDYLDHAGGGLPVPYRSGESYVDLDVYFGLWDGRASGWKTLWSSGAPRIEPGRYLVAESGYLVSEVRAIKKMGGNTFYLLDAGFNNLARPILYGSYHPMSIVPGGGERCSVRWST